MGVNGDSMTATNNQELSKPRFCDDSVVSYSHKQFLYVRGGNRHITKCSVPLLMGFWVFKDAMGDSGTLVEIRMPPTFWILRCADYISVSGFLSGSRRSARKWTSLFKDGPAEVFRAVITLCGSGNIETYTYRSTCMCVRRETETGRQRQGGEHTAVAIQVNSDQCTNPSAVP